MNPEDVSFWMMVFTAFMAIGTFLTVIVSIYYNRRAKLDLLEERDINKENLDEQIQQSNEQALLFSNYIDEKKILILI